jgi:stage V sporulation protein SpoVS
MENFKRIASKKVPPEILSSAPSLAHLQQVVRGMSREEISVSARKTLASMDQAKLAEFGTLLQKQMAKQGKTLPPGVSQGNVSEIADMLAGMMKNGNADLKQAFANPAVQESVKGVALARLAMGRFGLIAMLLRDPRMASVVAPVLRGLLRK